MNTKKMIARNGVSSLDRAIELATPQSLVHIKHSISLQQYKYFLLLFDEMCFLMDSGVDPDESGFYNIRMEKLADKIGYTPNKKELWADFVSLKNETIAVNFLMKDGQPIRYGAGYISEWGVSNSFIKFKFPSFFIEVAKKFKEQRRLFLQLNWSIFNSFSGKYEAILYKLCKDYENSGGKRTPEFSVEGFRDYMGLKDSEHKEYKIMKTWCITKPLKKVNESPVTDIEISLKEITSGRKVFGLYFEIKSKKQQSLPIETDPLDDPFMLARVPIPMNVQTDFLKVHTIEDAKLCIQAANEWIDAKVKAGETVAHGKAYRTALKENWKPNNKNIQQQKNEIETKKLVIEDAQKKKEQNEAIEKAKLTKWLDETLSAFDKLPEEQKKELKETFASGLVATRKSFDEKGEKAPLHRFNFAKFVEQHLKKL
jgi:hypothetical protein